MADTPEITAGVPCWADVMLPDQAAGKRFYGELFGWTFGDPETSTETSTGPSAETDPEPSAETGTQAGTLPGAGTQAGAGEYAAALLDGRRAAGLGRKADGRMPTAWLLYFGTPDIDATAARITEAGGQVITAPLEVGSGPAGVIAVAADPGGAVFGLFQPLAFGGFEVREQPGAYVWAEVYVREKEAVDAFYTDVFGFGTADIGEEGFDFLLWAPAGQPADAEHAIGGRCVIGDTFPAMMPSHFLTYFMVEDCDASVTRALELGGRVVFPPESSQYGRFAVLADNQGATFAVLDPSATGQDG